MTPKIKIVILKPGKISFLPQTIKESKKILITTISKETNKRRSRPTKIKELIQDIIIDKRGKYILIF
jgi:hypothetical protein